MFKLYNNIRSFFRYGMSDVFSRVWLETTRVCRHNCCLCPVDAGPAKLRYAFMPDSVFNRTVEQLKQIKFRGEVRIGYLSDATNDRYLGQRLSQLRNELPDARVGMLVHTDKLDAYMGKTAPAVPAQFVDYSVLAAAAPAQYTRRGVTWRKVESCTGGALKLTACKADTLIVLSSGRLISCPLDWAASAPFGHVFDPGTLLAAWHRGHASRVSGSDDRCDKYCSACEAYKP